MTKLIADLKRFWKHAALIGGIIALICHTVPPNYRVACDALAQLCKLGGK